MRILTVRQPWAWAIIHGGKDVENRVRNIAGDYRGPVAIHAGMREDTSARSHPEIIRLARERYWTEPGNLLTGRSDQFGHIIGVVDLVDMHRGHQQEDPDAWEPDEYCDIPSVIGPHPKTCSPWAEPNAHHLVLANPRPLAEPIPFKGALGLRRLDEETVAAITARGYGGGA